MCVEASKGILFKGILFITSARLSSHNKQELCFNDIHSQFDTWFQIESIQMEAQIPIPGLVSALSYLVEYIPMK